MATEAAVDALSLTDQTVLLGVAALDREGETPIQTPELREMCKTRLSDVETVVGTLTEADVMRSLYQLADEGLVEEVNTAETSPTGKGRPAYALNDSPDAICAAIDDELTEAILD